MAETKRDRIESIGEQAHIEFEALYAFVAKTSEFYDEWERKLSKEYSEKAESPDINEPFIRSLFQRTLESMDNMHSLLNNTTFTSCVSIFEFYLQQLCHILTVKGSITLDDLSGRSYIVKAKTFLIKSAGIDLQPQEHLWDRLFLHAQLRNKIVHEQSKVKISSQKSELYTKLKSLDGLTFTQIDETTAVIKIEDTIFIDRYIDDAAKYLRFVIDAVRQKIIEKGIEGMVD